MKLLHGTYLKHILAASFLMLALPFALNAQSTHKKQESLKVYFRQNSKTLDPDYMNNRQTLEQLTELLQPYMPGNAPFKGSVQIISSASPEGTVSANDRLIEERAKAIANWISQHFKLEIGYVVEQMHIDWQTFTTLVEETPDMPERDKVLEILRTTPENDTYARQSKLRNLSGTAYEWLYQHFYPQMRYAAVRTEVAYTPENISTPSEPVQAPAHEDAAVPVIQESQTPAPAVQEPATEEAPVYTRPFYMSISTNALYDLALIPNIGVEFYLGKNWSIDANWHHAWWKSDKRYRYWRTYGGDLALRKWFGKKAAQKPLTGHHAGLYGQMLTYDFEWGGRGYLADRWSYAAGIEYGYSLPIARRLNLDFNIGLGYHWGEYKEYLPIDGHYVWQATKNRKYMGPTKAEISLIWLIGNGNYNSKKGGNR